MILEAEAVVIQLVSAGNNDHNEVDYRAGIPGVDGITNLTYEGSSPALRASSSHGPGPTSPRPAP